MIWLTLLPALLLVLRFVLACFAKGSDRFAWRRDFGRDPVYMTRWQIARTPWFDLYINLIRHPDYDPLPHNHPWRWCGSVKLWGGYTEHVYWGKRCQFWYPRQPGQVSVVPRIHRIAELRHRRPALTLFLGVNRRESWGFFDVPNNGKFIPHKQRGERGQ